MNLTRATLAAGLWFAQASMSAASSDAWSDIVANVFDDRPMMESGIVSLEAPNRAEDAAIVPMTIRLSLPEDDPRQVEQVTLVVDENPAPVAATFELGRGVSEIETRVRVESYTPVHAVAELSDGSLHVAEKFVKASGGCAAPMSKDPAAALASLGQMKLRQFGGEGGAPPQAQIMVRHPNNSGLQMDQLTRYYIPAHFVHSIDVRQGDEVIIGMEGGISMSEDPSIRFNFAPNGAPITVEAVDTEDNVFQRTWPLEVGDGGA